MPASSTRRSTSAVPLTASPPRRSVRASKTGPSRHTSAKPPSRSGAAQPRQTPKPQAIGFSSDALQAAPRAEAISAQRRIIGRRSAREHVRRGVARELRIEQLRHQAPHAEAAVLGGDLEPARRARRNRRRPSDRRRCARRAARASNRRRAGAGAPRARRPRRCRCPPATSSAPTRRQLEAAPERSHEADAIAARARRQQRRAAPVALEQDLDLGLAVGAALAVHRHRSRQQRIAARRGAAARPGESITNWPGSKPGQPCTRSASRWFARPRARARRRARGRGSAAVRAGSSLQASPAYGSPRAPLRGACSSRCDLILRDRLSRAMPIASAVREMFQPCSARRARRNSRSNSRRACSSEVARAAVARRSRAERVRQVVRVDARARASGSRRAPSGCAARARCRASECRRKRSSAESERSLRRAPDSAQNSSTNERARIAMSSLRSRSGGTWKGITLSR